MSTQVDIQRLVADLYRVRIPTTKAHLLNSYLWLSPDGVTVSIQAGPAAAPPPPCRVDHEADDGDVLDFADPCSCDTPGFLPHRPAVLF